MPLKPACCHRLDDMLYAWRGILGCCYPEHFRMSWDIETDDIDQVITRWLIIPLIVGMILGALIVWAMS